MGPNKTDIYKLDSELYQNYQPEVITFYIKYITLISYTINAVECLPDISKTRPLTLLDYHRPLL